jgi:hypothetical protein
MSKVIFDLNQIKTEILCDENETMEQICFRYATKIKKDLKTLIFMYSGKIINLNLKFKNIISDLDIGRNCFITLVKTLDDLDSDNIHISKAKQSICPTCSEIATIEIKNYKLRSSCKKGHICNILISQYDKTQQIDQSKIICEICNKNNKSITFQNKFHRCNSCEKNICPLCISGHNKFHNIIDYDDINFYCEEHSELFNSYCKSCKKNLCIECEKYHQKHDAVNYGNLIPEKNKLKKELEEYKNIKEDFIKSVKDIINKLEKLNENMEILYKINEDIVYNYINSKSKRNFEIIMNVNHFQLNNNIFIKEMKEFIRNKSNYHEIPNLLNIYDSIVSDKNNDEFISFYELNKKYNELIIQNDILKEKLNEIKNETNKNKIFNNLNSPSNNNQNNINNNFGNKVNNNINNNTNIILALNNIICNI